MKRALPLALARAILVAAGAVALPAQAESPQGLDLFGESIIQPITVPEGGGMRIVTNSKTRNQAPEGLRHRLTLQSGAQLSGTLSELNAEDVVWTRPDCDVPLRLPRKTVRRIELRAPVPNSSQPAQAETQGPCPATIKLPGGDWLFGDVRMENADVFSVTLKGGTVMKIPRSQVEWMLFRPSPVPAFGFSGSRFDLDAWQLGQASATLEVNEHTFQTPPGCWIGRSFPALERFEVDFEIPPAPKKEDGGKNFLGRLLENGMGATNPNVRLWLQPFRPSPNTYSTGTIELGFGPKELNRQIFLENFDRAKDSWEEDTSGKPIRIRVFYDAIAQRLALTRNGKLVGEWPFYPPKEGEDAKARPKIRLPSGICFDAGNQGGPLTLGHLRMQPWDGVIPKPETVDVPRVSREDKAPEPGLVDGVTADEVKFEGKTAPRKAGTFVQLAQRPPGLPNPDALLVFDKEGEIAAANLEVRAGRARARTGAAGDFELPMEMLHTITLPKHPVDPVEGNDTLVFRNGDALTGTFLGASTGQSVRWQTKKDTAISLQLANLAGVRFHRLEPRQSPQGATLELANGDRFTGELVAFQDNAVTIRNAMLGERTVTRSHLHRLYPKGAAVFRDSGADPESWLGMKVQPRNVLFAMANPGPLMASHTFLDGHFLLPTDRSTSMRANLSYAMETLPDRFELRCDVTDPSGQEPVLYATLTGNNGSTSLQVQLGYGRLRVYGYGVAKARGAVFQQDRENSLATKLSSHTNRRQLRMFVDSKVGTVDFLVDGVHISKFGRQAADRVPGIGSQITFTGYSYEASTCIISNLSISPWNGDVPQPGQSTSAVYLANGDTASGAIGKLLGDRLTVGEGADELEIPVNRVTAVDFGAAPTPGQSNARLRLRDGSVLHLGEFHWEGDRLQGKSETLGALDLPVAAVAELIFSPAPPRFPLVNASRKPAGKTEEKPAAEVKP